MQLRNFLYRQGQRLRYHMANDPIEKRIAEINFHERRITVQSDGYYINSLGLLLPLSGFSFLFHIRIFELFLSNASRLSGTYSYENNVLLFSFRGCRIRITGASELFIINEIFVQNCYNFKIPGSGKVGVIDIGMNAGLASLFFASQSNVEKVISFEPFKPTFDKALANFQLNPQLQSKIFPNNIGLGNENTSLNVQYNSDNPGINSVTVGQGVDHAKANETVLLKEARSVINDIILENKDFDFVVKIDTEGAEYPIFESLFADRLNVKIRGFFIEWHTHGPAALEEKLIGEKFSIASLVLNDNTGLIYAFR